MTSSLLLAYKNRAILYLSVIIAGSLPTMLSRKLPGKQEAAYLASKRLDSTELWARTFHHPSSGQRTTAYLHNKHIIQGTIVGRPVWQTGRPRRSSSISKLLNLITNPKSANKCPFVESYDVLYDNIVARKMFYGKCYFYNCYRSEMKRVSRREPWR